MAASVSGASLAGSKLDPRPRCRSDNWVTASNLRMASRVSPKKSSRSGSSVARRPEIDDAAAQGEIAGIAHRAGPGIAIAGQERDQCIAFHFFAHLGDETRLRDRGARRHALQHRRDAGDDHGGTCEPLAPAPPKWPAARFRYRAWARPGRRADNPRPETAAAGMAGREERHGRGESLRLRLVAGDEQHRAAPAPRGFRRQPGVIARGRARNGQPSVRLGDVIYTFHVWPLRPQTAFSPANTGLSYSAGTGSAPRSQA